MESCTTARAAESTDLPPLSLCQRAEVQSRQQTRVEGSQAGDSMITLKRYTAGEVIVQEDDFGDTAYVIGQGEVEVSKQLSGQKVHLAYLGVGDTFGEMSMI